MSQEISSLGGTEFSTNTKPTEVYVFIYYLGSYFGPWSIFSFYRFTVCCILKASCCYHLVQTVCPNFSSKIPLYALYLCPLKLFTGLKASFFSGDMELFCGSLKVMWSVFHAIVHIILLSKSRSSSDLSLSRF